MTNSTPSTMEKMWRSILFQRNKTMEEKKTEQVQENAPKHTNLEQTKNTNANAAWQLSISCCVLQIHLIRLQQSIGN